MSVVNLVGSLWRLGPITFEGFLHCRCVTAVWCKRISTAYFDKVNIGTRAALKSSQPSPVLQIFAKVNNNIRDWFLNLYLRLSGGLLSCCDIGSLSISWISCRRFPLTCYLYIRNGCKQETPDKQNIIKDKLTVVHILIITRFSVHLLVLIRLFLIFTGWLSCYFNVTLN